ncbi:hypothetical protein FA95DRAFT_1474888, partial [Auriscalpium vulgare]
AILYQVSVARARRNALLAPVSLPVELLARIFAMVATTEHGNDADCVRNARTEESALGWIRVTHVCQRWRSAALACPTLWTEIDTVLGEGVAELLARSCNAPLSV